MIFYKIHNRILSPARKKTVFILIVSFCFQIWGNSKKIVPIRADKVSITHGNITIETNPNIELVSIIARLAGVEDGNSIYYGNSEFLSSVDSWFGEYRNHEAVLQTVELMKKYKITFDDLISLAVAFSDDATKIKVNLKSNPPYITKVWKYINANLFLEVVNSFAVASNFTGFYSTNRTAYIKMAQGYFDALEDGNVEKWTNNFYMGGESQSIVIHTSELLGGTIFYYNIPNKNKKSKYDYIICSSPYMDKNSGATLSQQISLAYIKPKMNLIWDEKSERVKNVLMKMTGSENKKLSSEEKNRLNNMAQNVVLELLTYANGTEYIRQFFDGDYYINARDSFLQQAEKETGEKIISALEKFTTEKSDSKTFDDFLPEEIDLITEFLESQCGINQNSQDEYTLDFNASLKVFLTEDEFEEDLKALKFLITTSYVGYETAVKNGFDIDRAIDEIRAETKKTITADKIKNKSAPKRTISVEDFERQIYEVFKREMKITDGHFSVSGFNKYSTASSKFVCWTGVYFKKEGNEYFVKKLRSDVGGKIENVKIGAKYTGPEKNLFRTIIEDEELYRYGVFTDTNLNSVTISVDGNQATIPVKKRLPFSYIPNWMNVIETENTVYASLQSFFSYINPVSEQKFSEFCHSLKSALPDKNLILDLRENRGGEVTNACQLVSSVFFPPDVDKDEHFEFYDFSKKELSNFKNKINAPARQQQIKYLERQYRQQPNLKDEYSRTLNSETEYADTYSIYEKEPEFKGKIFILISANTASASEYAASLFYLAKNAGITIIGENSLGAAEFGCVFTYLLPKSGISLSLAMFEGAPPCVFQNPRFMGEGNGFFPDYWITNDSLLPALIYLTGDKSLSERLGGIERRQQ